MKKLLFLIALAIVGISSSADNLKEMQQKFVNERFGMFIHFNMPTFVDQDWPDPDQAASTFNPQKLNCKQWAEGAKLAGMKFGCLTTKHHSGYCIWDTETTDYNCMDSGFGRDVVKEYAEAFREAGLDVMLYYSILDTPPHTSGIHQFNPHRIYQEPAPRAIDKIWAYFGNYYRRMGCTMVKNKL